MGAENRVWGEKKKEVWGKGCSLCKGLRAAGKRGVPRVGRASFRAFCSGGPRRNQGHSLGTCGCQPHGEPPQQRQEQGTGVLQGLGVAGDPPHC